MEGVGLALNLLLAENYNSRRQNDSFKSKDLSPNVKAPSYGGNLMLIWLHQIYHLGQSGHMHASFFKNIVKTSASFSGIYMVSTCKKCLQNTFIKTGMPFCV